VYRIGRIIFASQTGTAARNLLKNKGPRLAGVSSSCSRVLLLTRTASVKTDRSHKAIRSPEDLKRSSARRISVGWLMECGMLASISGSL
jgi:hypothetical protein